MIIKNNFIFLPNSIKIVLWKNNNNKKIFLFNENKKIILNLNNDLKIFINKWSNNIIVNNNILDNNKIIKNLNFFIKMWNFYFYKKIKFKGKGFRIKFFKKIKIIKFYFGKSHKTFLFFKKVKKKKINKYKFILISRNKKDVIKISNIIVNIKKINIYTLRGLRLNRQIIYKRKGKKGTYI